LYFKKDSPKNPLKYDRDSATFVIDGTDTVLKTITQLLDAGCTIRRDLSVIFPGEGKRGRLLHHIMSAVHQLSLDEVLSSRVALTSKRKADLRAENIYCSIIPRRETVSVRASKNFDELCVRYKPQNLVAKSDYSEALESVVTSPFLTWHLIGRAKSECLAAILNGGSKTVYLYQIRMAEHLYGLPTDREGFAATIERFRADYDTKIWSIDHLDGNRSDDRLINLFMMTRANNTAKGSYTSQIKHPYFFNSRRHSDTQIEVEAGGSPGTMIQGVFEIEEYMDTLKKFVAQMKSETAQNAKGGD